MSIGRFESTFDTYESVGVIGDGGSGRVFEVADPSGNIFAAKVLDTADRSSEKAKRFKNELSFCMSDRHPNIVRVLDHGLVKDGNVMKPFYLMKRFQSSLRELIREGMAPESAIAYFAQLLDGVEAAHLFDVVHRDIKPENFLYDGASLVLADFGIASFTEEDLRTAVKTKDSQRLANFRYAAPEQRAPGGNVDRRADIYALGLMLNELFTRDVPEGTRFKTIGDVAPEYEYLDPVVDEMRSHDPQDRPPDIDAVKNRLQSHKLEFVTRQRLNELDNTVIAITDVSGDPLIADPPRVVDFEWTPDGALTLILSREVTAEWVGDLPPGLGPGMPRVRPAFP